MPEELFFFAMLAVRPELLSLSLSLSRLVPCPQDLIPLDAGKIAVLLKHYAGQCSSQAAVAPAFTQAIFTQNPETQNPQNPEENSEPSLNIRAS